MVSRIDKAFVNQVWLRLYAGLFVQYLAPGISDHSPLLFTLQAASHQGGRPFKFMNIMADHVGFIDTVGKAWNLVNRSYRLQSVRLKIKTVKSELKMMQIQKFGKAH